MMKYICMLSGNDTFEIFTFPESVNHDVMAEALAHMKNQTDDDWVRVFRTPVSAGFVTAGGACHGRSEMLGLESRREDTELLRCQQ